MSSNCVKTEVQLVNNNNNNNNNNVRGIAQRIFHIYHKQYPSTLKKITGM
jgi:hypothetical protein